MRTAHGPWREREGFLLRLSDATGVVGFGEAAPIPWFGTETMAEIEAALVELGHDVTPELLAAVPEPLRCLRRGLAMAQGASAAPAARHAHLGVAALLPAGRAALPAIAPKAELGFRVFKWKVGVGDPADELSLLDDLCGQLPDGAKLRLDANGAWDRRRAERWLERAADRPVEFIEQPIAPDARGADDLLLGLAGDFPTPLGLDESLVNDGDVERWIGAGWPGIFVLKPTLLADAESAVRRLAAAKAEVVFSSALETAVAGRAALQLAFAWTGTPRALGFGVWPLFDDARCDGPQALPYWRAEDVTRLNPENVWNALA